jgi:hypothetical protein
LKFLRWNALGLRRRDGLDVFGVDPGAENNSEQRSRRENRDKLHDLPLLMHDCHSLLNSGNNLYQIQAPRNRRRARGVMFVRSVDLFADGEQIPRGEKKQEAGRRGRW